MSYRTENGPARCGGSRCTVRGRAGSGRLPSAIRFVSGGDFRGNGRSPQPCQRGSRPCCWVSLRGWGVGLIITGHMFVDSRGQYDDDQTAIDTDEAIGPLEAVAGRPFTGMVARSSRSSLTRAASRWRHAADRSRHLVCRM